MSESSKWKEMFGKKPKVDPLKEQKLVEAKTLAEALAILDGPVPVQELEILQGRLRVRRCNREGV